MKKFSKLLAVVLAIAIVICPMMSAVAFAEGENSVALTVDGNEAVLTINNATGFLVTEAELSFSADGLDTTAAGYTNGLKIVDYTLVDGTKDEYNLPAVSLNVTGDTAKVIVASTDAACLDLYSQVQVGIALKEEATVTVSNIKAADKAETPTYVAFDNIGEDGAPTETIEATAEATTVDFGTPTYDLGTGTLSIPYGAPSQDLKDELAYAKNTLGGRDINLIASLGGQEFAFPVKITTLGGTFSISGFTMEDLNASIDVFVRVTANGGYSVDYNTLTLTIADLITDTNYTALNDAMNAGETVVNINNATVETGLVDYSSITFTTTGSTLSINYDAPSTEFKTMLSTAKAAGNRQVQLIASLGGQEYAFDVKIMTGGGVLSVSGFTLSDFTSDCELFVRVTADGFTTVETNSVTVNIDSALKADSSAFATAYQAYVA